MEDQNLEHTLNTLKTDLNFYSETLKEVTEDILKNEVSKYPIFIAHYNEIEIGEVIVNRDEVQTNWSVNVTTLEEMIERGIISKNRKEEFIKVYKDPMTNLCVFVIM